MKKLLKMSSFLLLAVALVVVFSGCFADKDTNTNSTTKTDSTVTIDDSDEDLVEMTSEDVFGEDLADIDRYPDSIRSYYAKDEYETDITYETTDSEEKVREYYTDLLEDEGWTQVGVATDYIDFEKGDEDNPEILTVYFTPYEDEGFLEYELVYSPPLTDEELAELEEDDEDFIEIE